MEITKDTPLEDILKSQEVNDTISNMLNPIRQTISDRDSMLTTAMQSGGGLDEGQLIDGEPIIFKSAQEVKDKYSKLLGSLNDYEINSAKASIDKERSELLELKACLEKEISRLTELIETLRKEYNDALANAKDDKEREEISRKYTELIKIETINKEKYEEKLRLVNDRLATLDGTGAGQGVLAGQQGTNGPNYKIDTTGSANDIYKSALALKDEVEVEIKYLEDRINELEYNLRVLERWKEAGKISEDTYETLKAEYETEKTRIESEKEIRQEYYKKLSDATKNRWGTHDGPLKDARDGQIDVDIARRFANEINTYASTITPLSDLATVKYEDGYTRVVSPLSSITENYVEGAYSGNVSGLIGDFNQPTTTVSDTTMKAAHEVAQSSGQVHTDSTGKVQIFSTAEYVLNPPNLDNSYYSNGYLMSEYGTLQANEVLGNIYQYGDTIYDTEEGRYYSIAEYLETHKDFSLYSFQ